MIVIAWAFFTASTFAAVVVVVLDRRLQQFRRRDLKASAYLWVPDRLRKEFYLPEAMPLLDKLWEAVGWMYGLGFLGIIASVFAGFSSGD